MKAPPLAAVLGAPIGHSKSPRLHGHWLTTYDLPGHYIPMDVAPDDLPEVLAQMPKMGFVGANVTLPHKEAALALATDVSDRAAQIGAANTLTFLPGGGFHADNTDGYGFTANLKQHAPDWDAGAGPALVLGAGGAARAIISALLEEGAPEVVLTNRTIARAEALKAVFGERVTVCPWAEVGDAMGVAMTLVNTTSLGMTGHPALEISLDPLSVDALVTDIVYTPLMTDLLIQAQAKGCRTVDGVGMLLHQAVPGFARWFGQTPEVTEALRNAVLAP